MTTQTCARCGNPVPAGNPVCPYCGSFERVGGPRAAAAGQTRTVDLGHRRLSAREAGERLQGEVERAAAAGERFLRLVHGHGSTGRGGVLRTALRGELARLRGQGRIAAFIAGELLSGDTNEGRGFARRYPEARAWPDWNAGNEGVTIVVIG